MTLRTGNHEIDPGWTRSAGFTLIELILLMAILTITAAIVVPSMSKFLTGRTQNAEAQRLLSLIHYGQNRAVSEGLPVVLWIDAKNGTYGLQIETGYTDSDPKAVDFVADKDLGLGVAQSKKQPARNTMKLPAIHFQPDGTLGVGSVTGIYFQDRDKGIVWVAQSPNGLSYEIEDQITYKQTHR
jgi:type II secretion system protein H